jgi:DNA-damage-inducible protein J
MAQVNIRIDDTIKEQAETLFNTVGLTMSAAITLFLHQAILQKGIPFKITAQEDPLYNPVNIARIKESIEQHKQGRFVAKTIEELEQMADE